MPYIHGARAHATTRGTIRVVLTLGEEKDAIWTHFFNLERPLTLMSETDPGVIDERVVNHEGVLDEVAAELRPGASEDMVLQTLDWLSDTADKADAQRLAYLDALKKTERTVEKWFNSQ